MEGQSSLIGRGPRVSGESTPNATRARRLDPRGNMKKRSGATGVCATFPPEKLCTRKATGGVWGTRAPEGPSTPARGVGGRVVHTGATVAACEPGDVLRPMLGDFTGEPLAAQRGSCLGARRIFVPAVWRPVRGTSNGKSLATYRWKWPTLWLVSSLLLAGCDTFEPDPMRRGWDLSKCDPVERGPSFCASRSGRWDGR